ncbi:hypothetical protein P171DRAFT_482825 [Karstenula rhodostoma CBS 690.94]|uniref:Heterokaryon incompatibility domain-containing protein n=1 Tax=Karstenula rhodostoma CBS 690.94 TaxID=1392251 RepID=A0A9P4PPQ9_9PLEO|nr:hypothetical protein P171DRAFT_482825 [Karstenula rhodostoma CBS 690.94]
MPTEKFGGSPFNFEQITHAIWIDALCIDQDNPRERNHQVRLFSDIYLNSEVVLAWMGTNLGLTWLFKAWTDRVYHKGWWRIKYPRLLAKRFGEWEASMRTRLLNNTYWTRAWTTQESLLAHKFMLVASNRCLDLIVALLAGRNRNWKMPEEDCRVWEQLLDSNASIFRRDPGRDFLGLSLSLSTSVSGLRQRESYSTAFLSLERLWEYRARSCTEPRDKIFSLLSVSCNGHEMDMDYNVTKEETALRFLQTNQDDFCLCHAVMVFDTLEAKILHMVGTTGPDNHRNFVDFQIPVENDLEGVILLADDLMRFDLTCHHINKVEPGFGVRSYHTRTFRGGSLRLQMPSAPSRGDVRALVHPVYWVDPLTQMSSAFSYDEHIYFAWEHGDSCTLRFSLPAFARLITLLGSLEERVELIGATKHFLTLPSGNMPSQPVILAAPLMSEHAALDAKGFSRITYKWPRRGETHISNLEGDPIPIRIADPNPMWSLLPQLDRPRQCQDRSLSGCAPE